MVEGVVVLFVQYLYVVVELDPRYASVIVQRYVDSVGADSVKVLRDGCELTYSEVTA